MKCTGLVSHDNNREKRLLLALQSDAYVYKASSSQNIENQSINSSPTPENKRYLTLFEVKMLLFISLNNVYVYFLGEI